MFRPIAGIFLFAGALCAGSVQLNPGSVDTSLFTVTDFATGLSKPLSLVQFSDGSIGTAEGDYGSGSTLLQFPLGGGSPQSIYTGAAGPITGLVWAGDHLLYGNSGAESIGVLQPGATSSSPMTPVGALQFSYPGGWEHSQMGMATEQVPGMPNSWNVVFNVGAQYNDTASTGTVGLSGLGLTPATLQGDSLYMVTLTFDGSQVTASNLQQVASGIRNVVGMGFDPYNGNFYFADNAIDGPPGTGNETDPNPPQADELNVISAADLGNGVIDFGYPNCYIQYVTGTPVGSGCVQPLAAFQPINGSRTQGPFQLVFAPPGFPAGYNDGVYISFAGESASGVLNDDDGVVYYSFDTGQYIQFIPPSEAGIGKPLGLLATSDTLYLADWNYNYIEAITTATPEPGTFLTMLLPLAGLFAARLYRCAGGFTEPRL